MYEIEKPVIGSWYQVVALRTASDTDADRLKSVLAGDYTITADRKRSQFFELTSGEDWFYIHTHESRIYLLAHGKRTVLGPEGPSTPNGPRRQSADRAVAAQA